MQVYIERRDDFGSREMLVKLDLLKKMCPALVAKFVPTENLYEERYIFTEMNEEDWLNYEYEYTPRYVMRIDVGGKLWRHYKDFKYVVEELLTFCMAGKFQGGCKFSACNVFELYQ